MSELFTILIAWSLVLTVDLSVVAAFVWLATRKKE